MKLYVVDVEYSFMMTSESENPLEVNREAKRYALKEINESQEFYHSVHEVKHVSDIQPGWHTSLPWGNTLDINCIKLFELLKEEEQQRPPTAAEYAAADQQQLF